MSVSHLYGVYCDGVFLYLHVMANFVCKVLCAHYKIMYLLI